MTEQPPLFPTDAPSEGNTLAGTVERIVYESADTRFLVGRLQREDSREKVTFVGSALNLAPGQRVRLVGAWSIHPKFGRQFEVKEVHLLEPETQEGIEQYLGSGLIHGIGPELARRLVAAFGRETLRVIEEEPERLTEVPGIGEKRAAQIREAFVKQREAHAAMVFLSEHGIGPTLAARIYKHFGAATLTVLRQHPYRLAEDIPGIGLRTADAIAQKLGLAPDVPERIVAGLIHTLHEAANEGHLFLEEDTLVTETAGLLDLPEEIVRNALPAFVTQGKIVSEQGRVYLPSLFAAETEAAYRLARLRTTEPPALAVDVERAIAWAEKRAGLAFSQGQRLALRRALTEKLLVITGGPGTGKTTVVKSILAIFERKGVPFLLASPTGRAAKHLESVTGHPAKTLHRLLEFSPVTQQFARNETHPLATDLVIVDEASMIDQPLLANFLAALRPTTRLIFIGDVDQLPSVGPGNVLFDLIAGNVIPVVRLDTVFRQAGQSGIVSNAHRINRGLFPIFNQTDFRFIAAADAEDALRHVLEWTTRILPEEMGADPLRDVQVLSPMHRGEAGVTRLNAALQAALNPKGESIPKRAFRVGDKVMQLRNNYELDVYNGDMGRITRVDAVLGEVEVAYDDRRVLYSFDELDNLGLAYAVTVHKSQGSEYPYVVLPLLREHYLMLQRNVLYTAVTRAKRQVVIIGDYRALGRAVRNNKITRRKTAFAERLRLALQPGN